MEYNGGSNGDKGERLSADAEFRGAGDGKRDGLLAGAAGSDEKRLSADAIGGKGASIGAEGGKRDGISSDAAGSGEKNGARGGRKINRSTYAGEPVSVKHVDDYDRAKILRALTAADAECGIFEGTLSGKKIVIKPNLVAKRSPESAATAHPAVVAAVIEWLRARGADNITLAESPGGVYNAARLRGIYAATGMQALADEYGVKLNYDCTFRETTAPDGTRCRLFDIIAPILDADVIIDVCKLKTHALTGMSAAVKNMFGTIPGIVKFEMHSRYPDYGNFAEMLVDLCQLLADRCEFVSVTDGIVAMEGNGPTAGDPRPLGVMLVSRNPFVSDAAAAHLIGRDKKIATVEFAAGRGISPESFDGVNVVGEKLEPVELAMPDSVEKNGIEIMRNLFGGKIYDMFRPYPVIGYADCVGCGECAASCPQHTITMTPPSEAGFAARRASAHRVPVIDRESCIRCFCCQELCPHGVVKIKKNPITRILS